ncbi:hypothetical protein J6590_027494 [Homalodisca vitripennis]|nr:hypothetical protein J6590_027494 [Homalodisca vitripennis]
MDATHSSLSPSPKFDRSNKPKPAPTYESYTPRNADNDIVYLANNKNESLAPFLVSFCLSLLVTGPYQKQNKQNKE